MRPPEDETGGAPEPPEDAAENARPPASKQDDQAQDSAQGPIPHESEDAHPQQFPLPGFDIADLADEGDLRWHATAEATLHELASRGVPFTADHVREAAGVPTSRNRIGILFALASQRGEIEALAAVRSSSRSRRHGMVTLWRGAA